MIGSVTSAMTKRYPEDTESTKKEPQPCLFQVCMCETFTHMYTYVRGRLRLTIGKVMTELSLREKVEQPSSMEVK